MKTPGVAGLLPLMAFVAGLFALLFLSSRLSNEPTVLGRWSTRFAFLLALLLVGTLTSGVLSVPAWRRRLLQVSGRSPTRHQAWALLTGGLLLLPVAFLALQTLLPVSEGGLTRTLLMLTLCALTLPVLLALHRSGAGSLMLHVRRPGALLLLVFGVQIILVLAFHGQVPTLKAEGEIWNMGSGLRQFADLRSFVSLSPDRNAQTWFHFFALWPVSGAFMQLVGPGLLQARFFYLLIAWLALPFLYLCARKRYGKTAALVTVILASYIPLHYNWAVAYVQVPVATSIALTALIFSRPATAHRPRLLNFTCGFFAVAAVDGHPYGVAFAIMFCALQLVDFLRRELPLRQFVTFVAGCASYTAFYAAYHIALPGLALSQLPEILEATWGWETAIGAQEFGVGLTAGNVLNMAKLYLYHLPHELLLALLLPVSALLRRDPDERRLLLLLAGSLLIVGLLLGHVNEFYMVFLFPFISLWFGAWIADRGAARPSQATGGIGLTFTATYVLFAVLVLYLLQTIAVASYDGTIRKLKQLEQMTAIGREIDGLLPAEDIVIAGHEGYYLGMPQRLNYGSSFSFTWDLPAYWPLEEPRYVIVTRGVDDSYSGLGKWLRDHEFRPARCFALPSVGDDAVILYVSPQVTAPGPAGNCSPEALAWLNDS